MVDSPAFELRTYGGLRVLHDGVEAAPLPDRSAVLLGALIAARGRAVSRSELVDLIWPTDPPGSAINQLHRYVGELRRVLEPALGTRDAGSLIERHVDAYRLRSDLIDVDLDRFDRLVAEARSAIDAADAVERLLEALELGAMPAFADLTAQLSRSPDVAAIEATRIAAGGLLASVALDAPDTGRAVATVVRIAAQDPLNEVLQAGCIRLLTAAGRGSEALAHYAATAAHLRETIGADPGEALRAAHREALSPGSPPTPPAGPAWISNLPSANPAFVDPPGLDGRLAHLDRGGVASGTITVLTGGGGIGKTTLAVHLARTIERESGASSLFIDLRGFDPELPALTPAAAIGAALDQLDVEHGGLMPEAEARLLRSSVRSRPVVAVLDSAADAHQLRPLLACLSGSTVIVTTRSVLQTLVVREGARLVQLDRWDEAAAYELLVERLGIDPSAERDPVLSTIARACAGLPLALAVAAARCSTIHPRRWLGLAQELSDAVRALDALSAGAHDDVRSVFATSLRALDDMTVTVFRRIALIPAASADPRALAAVAGTGLVPTGLAVSRLLDSSLIAQDGDGRYSMHDLVRSYALELLDPDERAEAESRALSYIALTAQRAWSLTGRPPVGTHSPSRIDEDVVVPLADIDEAQRWTGRNANWLETLGRAATGLGLVRDVLTATLDLRPYLDEDMSISRSIERSAAVEVMAVEVDEPALLAESRAMRGFAFGIAGRAAEARPFYESAITLFTSIGDAGGIAKTYRNMAADAARLRHFEDADRFASRAVESALESGNQSLIFACRYIRLAVLEGRGMSERIVEVAPELVRDARRFAPGELFDALDLLAFALYRTGAAEEALATAQEALTLSRGTAALALQVLPTVALAEAALGHGAASRAAIARFESLVAEQPANVTTYFGIREQEVRDRIALAKIALQEALGDDPVD